MTAPTAKPGELITANKIDEMMRAGAPVIAVQTHEEERFIRFMRTLAKDEYHKNKPLHVWSRASGLKRISPPPVDVEGTEDPVDVLDHVKNQKAGIFVLCDFAPHLAPNGQEDLVLIRVLRELAFQVKAMRDVHVFVVGPTLPEVTSLEKEVEIIELPLPTGEEVHMLVENQLKVLKNKVEIGLTQEGRERLEGALLGLTHVEIDAAISKGTVHFGRVDDAVVPLVIEEKKSIIRRSGALDYLDPLPEGNIGGYAHLRHMLHQAAVTYEPRAKEFGVEPSKGLLLVGLPGCGKDLSMRVAGSILGRPVVRMDMGVVMGEGGGIIGQAEMSMKRALQIADTMQGILGISEFEKGTGGAGASGQLDAGTTARTISILLNWMQEQEGTFVFATANDVQGLAPEQLRQGRFEHIVFIDLPTFDDRKDIFRVHLRKRNRDPERFDLDALAEATGKVGNNQGDFSGAEIEAVVRGALVDALMDGSEDIATDHLVHRARTVKPLSKIREADIAGIREWARVHLNAVGPEDAFSPSAHEIEEDEEGERVVQI